MTGGIGGGFGVVYAVEHDTNARAEIEVGHPCAGKGQESIIDCAK
tara:strand:+ start:647 stop:781 length:135 start_codon:yes stop_codon:yes gene_type:complete